jgi:hypothetical protein
MPSFLSETGPLIHAGPARACIEPGRARLGLSPNSGLRVGLADLLLIGHLYTQPTANHASIRPLVLLHACIQGPTCKSQAYLYSYTALEMVKRAARPRPGESARFGPGPLGTVRKPGRVF